MGGRRPWSTSHGVNTKWLSQHVASARLARKPQGSSWAEHAALRIRWRRHRTARPACCGCALGTQNARVRTGGTRGAPHQIASKPDGSAGMLRMRGWRGDAILEMGRISDIASASASSSEPVPRVRVSFNKIKPDTVGFVIAT